ncbi:MAG: hypothetical protein WCP36_09765 [Methanomicrobiales archaeon]
MNSRLIFTYDAQERLPEYHNLADVRFRKFPEKLLKCLDKEIRRLKNNPEKWNLNLENHLSYNKRFGRIRRADFWSISGNESERLDNIIGSEGIKKLSAYIRKSISTDPADGKTYLKIPIESKQVIEQAIGALAALFGNVNRNTK